MLPDDCILFKPITSTSKPHSVNISLGNLPFSFNEELTDLQEIHFIELPKLPKNEEMKDVFDAWMEFIENPISNKLEKAEMTIKK
nr:Rpn family recombination-promoting nuclease/putative transposase [Clostridium sp. 1001271B_151109_B4]